MQFLVFAFALISRFENNEAAENGSNIALVEAIVFVCGMIALLFFSFILVFAIFYAAIRTAFGYISIKKKGRTSQEVLSKSMFPIFKLLPMLVITQLILPELNYGLAIWIIVILALALIAVAVLVSRLIIYDAPDLKYFNAFQGASALGFIGLVFFLMNLMKTALLNVAIVRIIDTAFFVGIPSGNFFNLFYLAFLIVLFITVSCSLRSINRISSKLACISNAKSQVGIGKSVWMLFIIIIPAVMMLFGDSIFYLTTERLTALILTAVGIIIIITAEILLSVFTKKFGQGSSEENRRRIARGTYVFEWIH